MKRTIVLTVKDGSRVTAMLEDGRLTEWSSEKEGDERAGDIYLARAENPVKGVGAAFVDIGDRVNAFLPEDSAPLPRRGEVFPVQVKKDRIGAKGARVTRRLAFPGRYAVALANEPHAGVSKKVADPRERERLRCLGEDMVRGSRHGVILRTGAAGADERDVREEYAALCAEADGVLRRAEHAKAPCLLYGSGGRQAKTVNDWAADPDTAFATDREDVFRDWAGLLPEGKIRLETGFSDILSAYGVTGQLRKLTGRTVPLRSGGGIVIDVTEAMTVIDVNSARFTGGGDAEETVLRVNLEAARECARQLRLRDMGGIVIVDFIDMAKEEHRRQLLDALEEELSRDRSRARVAGITNLGLVEITRRRTHSARFETGTAVCPVCGGTGRVPYGADGDCEE